MKKRIDDIILWKDYLKCRVFEFQSGEYFSVREYYVYVGATFVRTNLESNGGGNTSVDDDGFSCNLDSPLHFIIIINYIIIFGYFCH